MGITLNSALVCDNSTLTNFKQWASAISAFLQTSGSGLSQTSDTGQVNWSSIASVPTSGNYVYEMYKNTDALTTFYFKIEYGTGSSSSNPRIRISIGTSTNGAGTLSGFVTTLTPFLMPGSDSTPPSTSIQYNCYFSAAPGRLSILMWRDTTSTQWPLWFGFERSCDSSGNYNSTFVTLLCCQSNSVHNSNACCGQQSVVFGTGVGILVDDTSSNDSGFICLKNLNSATALFNGNFSISPIFPDVGGFGNPHRVGLVASYSDITEGATYTIASGNMPYGVSKTYIGTKNGVGFRQAATGNSSGLSNACAFLAEYD